MATPNTNHDRPLRFPPKVQSVAEFLSEERLRIPLYQRPYKWTVRHVSDLFSDLAGHAHRSAYRLGTVVLHREAKSAEQADRGNPEDDPEEIRLNLVDGQQRTLTLLLAVRAMLKRKDWKSREVQEELAMLRPKIERFCKTFQFNSDISRENLKRNSVEIELVVSRSDFTDDLALFFLRSCQVVVFTLTNISEAFQFFDSQNARGKDLDPHDLLKAYHLREFGPKHEREDRMTKTIEVWEAMESKQLAHFFENHWFRIRNWSRGKSARYFTKAEVGTFKGVSLTDSRRYPVTQMLRVAHYFTDHHRAQYERQIDEREMPFPFQFDQAILNGRRFFEMTSHYLALAKRFTSDPLLEAKGAPQKGGKEVDRKPRPDFPDGVLNDEAREILTLLDEYDGRHRRGDEYVRNLFDCLLLFYIDRFGMEEISRAIEKIFLWAYRLRVEYDRIQLASVDNHAQEAPSPFQILRDATHPADFLQMTLQPANGRSKRAEAIETKFIEKAFIDKKHLNS